MSLPLKTESFSRDAKFWSPKGLRQDILTQLHNGHQGIQKTRNLARETVYWPGITKDIQRLCESWHLCQEMQPQQPRQPMQMHEKPDIPWVKVRTDLFEVDGFNFLIIGDYFSRYPVIKQLTSTTSSSIIAATKETFALLGVPREVISDNGSQYQSAYNNFCEEWGIKHTTSSPWHAQSNGYIECQIHYLKPIMKKCMKSGRDVNLVLLNVRATTLDAKLPGPAELMFGRPITTTLPSHTSELAPEVYRDHLRQVQDQQKAYADQHTRERPPLLPGKQIRILDKTAKTWCAGRVVARNSDRSYLVATEGGRNIVWNRSHQREMPAPAQSPPTTPATNTRQQPEQLVKTPVRPPIQPMTPTMTRSGRVGEKPKQLIEECGWTQEDIKPWDLHYYY